MGRLPGFGDLLNHPDAYDTTPDSDWAPEPGQVPCECIKNFWFRIEGYCLKCTLGWRWSDTEVKEGNTVTTEV